MDDAERFFLMLKAMVVLLIGIYLLGTALGLLGGELPAGIDYSVVLLHVSLGLGAGVLSAIILITARKLNNTKALALSALGMAVVWATIIVGSLYIVVGNNEVLTYLMAVGSFASFGVYAWLWLGSMVEEQPTYY